MNVADITGGGAPILGEPLPIELGNTAYAVRGRLMDGLETIDHLAAWLRDVRPRLAIRPSDADLLGVTGDDLRLARELRETIRQLAAAAAAGQDADPGAVTTLNHLARQAARWHELRVAPEPHVVVCAEGRPVAAALSALADDAVTLFGGPARHGVHACQGPGCRLHFVRETPRREWCSAGCGNRARAARHYAKVRDHGPHSS
ncbi:CGNR zinc finger domain-containing protein [Nonomuraea sp. LPB2021202275-12-8]|uniref:CGNR zinc finger domain-containing protein n=1 Tax=Nonomuraea sp. LPB2021202275-12-8 TaxID=3120159 RepID=UPI00300D612F